MGRFFHHLPRLEKSSGGERLGFHRGRTGTFVHIADWGLVAGCELSVDRSFLRRSGAVDLPAYVFRRSGRSCGASLENLAPTLFVRCAGRAARGVGRHRQQDDQLHSQWDGDCLLAPLFELGFVGHVHTSGKKKRVASGLSVGRHDVDQARLKHLYRGHGGGSAVTHSQRKPLILASTRALVPQVSPRRCGVYYRLFTVVHLGLAILRHACAANDYSQGSVH